MKSLFWLANNPPKMAYLVAMQKTVLKTVNLVQCSDVPMDMQRFQQFKEILLNWLSSCSALSSELTDRG